MNKDEAIKAMVCKKAHVTIPNDRTTYYYSSGEFFHGDRTISVSTMPRRDYELVKGILKRTYCYTMNPGGEIELTRKKYSSEKEALKNLGGLADAKIEIIGILYGSEELIF
jgi:hypothetical protein